MFSRWDSRQSLPENQAFQRGVCRNVCRKVSRKSSILRWNSRDNLEFTGKTWKFSRGSAHSPLPHACHYHRPQSRCMPRKSLGIATWLHRHSGGTNLWLHAQHALHKMLRNCFCNRCDYKIVEQWNYIAFSDPSAVHKSQTNTAAERKAWVWLQRVLSAPIWLVCCLLLTWAFPFLGFGWPLLMSLFPFCYCCFVCLGSCGCRKCNSC